MRSRLPAILLLLLAASAGPAPLAAQQRIDRRLAVDADVSVRIANLVGYVRVIGWDRDSLAVTGTLPAGAGQLFVGGSRRAAKVVLDGPPEATPTASATVEIRVPRNAKLWIKGAASEIEIGDFAGELEVYAVNGRVRVDGAPRQATIETVDGNVEMEGPAPSVRVKTAGGAIVLRYTKGDVTASSVSGPIRLGGAEIERGHFESVSGEVSVKASLRRGGTLEVQTHSGPIELRLPPTTSADFDLTAYGGGIESELGDVRAGPSATPGDKVEQRRFSLNDGSALVTARTFKGGIRVLRQPLP